MATVHPFPHRQRIRKGRRKQKRRPPKRSYLPETEQINIISDYLSGGPDNSIQRLAIKYNRDVSTITYLVRSDVADRMKEAQIQAQQNFLRDRILPASGPRILSEIRNRKSKMGATLAMDIWDRLGILPPKAQRIIGVTKTGQQGEATLVGVGGSSDEMVAQLTEAYTRIGLETRRAFGLPLPRVEEVAEARRRTVDIPLVPVREEDDDE